MPTWEWGPLYFASLLHACKDLNTFDPDHWKAMQNTYSIFRGIPRSCLWFLDPDVLEAQKAEIKIALDSLTFLDDFARAISGRLPFNPNTSHHLVRVEPIDTKWLRTRTEIKSNYIAELTSERILKLATARFSDKLMGYLANPDTRAPAGILFEQAAHYSIRKGLTSTMTRLPSGTTLDVSIPGIPVEKNEKGRYCSLSIPGSQVVHPDFLNLYMTTKAKSKFSIDALFISSEHITYLFQMTVSRRHPIDFQGLDEVFKYLPAKAQKDGIQTVQIIDPPQNPDLGKVKKYEKLPQYVCRLDLSKIGWDEQTSEVEESGEDVTKELAEIPSDEDEAAEKKKPKKAPKKASAEDKEEKAKAKKEKREREKKEREKKEREKKEKEEKKERAKKEKKEEKEREEKKKEKEKNGTAPKEQVVAKKAAEEVEDMGDVQDDPEAEQDARKRRKKPAPKRAKLASTRAKLLEVEDYYDAEE